MTDRLQRSIEVKAPVERVWRALTDHAEFSQWFRVNMETPFRPGETTRGNIAYPGYEHLVMEVEVVDMEPPRLFSYRWHPHAIHPQRDYSAEPATLVEFRLEPAGEGTRVTVTETGFDGVAADRRDLAFRMNTSGWEEQLRNIKAHVEG